MKKANQYNDDQIIDFQHPYAGLYSFRETDSNYFFGRGQEIADLINLIEDNVLTVVFGKSSIGKTSLLRAGLTPYIRKNYYLPIYLRIDFNNEEKQPVAQAKETITQKIKEMDPLIKSMGNLTLWEYFSTIQIQRGIVRPLLVFDQFEEMFTTGKNNPQNINEFVTELADLIENRVPSKIREKLKNEKRRISFLDGGHNLKVIISLREDYLAQLETLYKYIPSLRFGRYRVAQMKGRDAIDAVLKPGKDIIKDPAVAEEIIKKIPASKDADYSPGDDISGSWQNKKIEPFLLSLFCYQVNEKRLEKKAAEISTELINTVNAEGIIKDYYEENISRFKPEVITAIEDLLVTSEGFRKLHDLNSMATEYKVETNDIEALIDRRIIRKETRCDIEYVELIHDLLAPILKESRDKRFEEEKRKTEADSKRIKNRRVIITFAMLLLVIMAVLTMIVSDQQRKLEKQRAQDEERKGLTYERAAYSIDSLQKDRDLSFRLAESAFNTDPNNPVAFRALLSAYYDTGIDNEMIDNKNNELAKTVSEKADFFAIFSPDGSQILTTVSDKAVLWSLEGGQWYELKILQPPEDLELYPNAAFSPDDKYIISCTKSDTKIILWNLAENQTTSLNIESGVNSVAFSPITDQNMIVVASRDKKVRLFDLAGKIISTLVGHTGVVNSAAFSPDGKKYIISAGWDAVRLWGLTGGQVREPFVGDGKGFSSASFSLDEQFIVTAGLDGNVQLWDLKNNKNRTLGTHKGAVTSAVFSPDGRYILTGSEDKTVRLLTRNNFLVFEFKGFTDTICTVMFSPDGKNILIAPTRGPAQLRLIDPQEIIRLVNSKGNIRPLTADEKETYNLHNL